ncbi:Ig-like domain-containing protein [Tessaracoccus antarcticus]|uniref:Bacterial Ig-like domain-containing protein n=1 Tax=Tessaracoccus antarcticus TaxID=2479848 RepID=A0A3M0G9B5_9ACTN|nr:Ig-like domain-containing protein [Tessaracoccus antarcticus]RMB61591.1 hypothetical protein EAX62_02870 [Tessaracoccus antarcticus]
MSHSLRGLEWGKHTVRFTQTSGSLDIDAVGVASTPALAPASAGPIVAPLANARATQRSDAFTDDSWALLQRLITQADRAVTNPAAYRLDGEGVEQIVERLQRATNPELSRIISLESPHLATWQGEAPELPATVTATLDDGSTLPVDVEWNAVDDSAFGNAWSVVEITGTHGPLAASARVEVVPRGTVAFGDVNASAAGDLGRNSPAWVAINGLVGGLVNEAPDQVREGDATWGHWAQTAQGTKNIAPKGIVTGPYDKTTTTGISTANAVGAQVEYTFDLAAGDYTITAASHTWWPGNARSAAASIVHDGQSTPLRSITLGASHPTEVISGDITLAKDGRVTFILKATNGQSPLLSWAAAVRHDAPATYSVAYDLNGGEGAVPAPRTGAAWTDDGFFADASGLTRPGHTFEGWNTASDGGGIPATATTAYSELAGGDVGQLSITLYAQWKDSGPTAEPSPEPSEEPSVEPSPEPSVEPSAGPSPKPTQGPTQVPTVTVTAPPSVRPTPVGDVYSTPGFHVVNGRKWYTACEPYSRTVRCRTEIWATQVTSVNGVFVTSNGWVFNNLTYLPLMTRAQWSANPLGHATSWTAADGRRWKTECDTVATGSNGCRSWAWTTFVASRQNSNGTWTHFHSQGWVFNNIVRFAR